MTCCVSCMANAGLNKRRLLAIDTGGAHAFCALACGDGRVIEAASQGEASHNEELALLIDGLFAGAGTAPKELEAVVIGSGPGSFTGLRIGYSMAKGICYSLGIPLVEVPSQQAI